MTAPVSRPAALPGCFGRLWWLPAGGYGNGLDDQAWAPALQVSGQVVPQLLSALQEAAVPATPPGCGTRAIAARSPRATSCG
jgi:hypothetical protein